MTKQIILLAGGNKAWRYDQIAAIEVEDCTLTIIPVNGFNSDQWIEYEYADEETAQRAYERALKDWNEALLSP